MRRIFIIALFMLVLLGTALNAASWSLILEPDVPVIAAADGSTINLDNDIYLKRWNGLTLDRVQDGAYLITDRDGYSILIFTEDASDDPYETGWTLERYGTDTEAVIFQGTLPDADALEYADPMRILSTELLSSKKIWEFRQLGHSLKAIPRFSIIRMDDGRMTIRSERDTRSGWMEGLSDPIRGNRLIRGTDMMISGIPGPEEKDNEKDNADSYSASDNDRIMLILLRPRYPGIHGNEA